MKLALCAAFPHELKHILGNLNAQKISGEVSFALFLAGHASHEILIIQTGMGRHAAEAALQHIIREHKPDLVLSIGFCGALQAGVKPGDLIWSTETMLIPERRSDGMRHANLPVTHGIGRKLAEHVDLRKGVFITTERRLAKEQVRSMLPRDAALFACDMETFYIAEICRTKGVPFLALRAVTDLSDEDIPAELFSVVDGYGIYRPAKALMLLIGRPRLIPYCIKLGINSEKASRNLWHAVKVLLKVLQEE